MRFLLALSALVIITIDPAEPDRLVAITYLALSLYTIYSLVLYVIVQRYAALQVHFRPWAHWADVGWYVVLIGLSSGTSSIFFFFFFFAILVASFRWGRTAGLRVVVISAILFTIIGFLTAPGGHEFELNRFLLRPIYLFVLGYMMAYWGGYEIKLKRQLGLLKEVNTLANPRFGVDRTTGSLLARLCSFYSADACMLITMDAASGAHQMRRADRHDPERATRAEPLPQQLTQRFLALGPNHVIVYNRTPRLWSVPYSRSRVYNVVTHGDAAEDPERIEALAAALDAASFVVVPLGSQGTTSGWLYLTSARGYGFDESDADFLLQVIGHFTPVIENIRLVDRLASDAAEAERQRIARDLHDSVIQPYIGLQIALSAIDQKLETGDTNVGREIKLLREQIGTVIGDLRSYMHGLKSPGEHESVLLGAVRRFAAAFSEATGIDVDVRAAEDLRLNDRLAAEVFQMVSEGLSNIRRHTHAMQVTIGLDRRDHQLVMRIEDEAPGQPPPQHFSPRSITERAVALGGRVRVDQHTSGSIVIVEIPL
jgi:signal transduction histidine kinase